MKNDPKFVKDGKITPDGTGRTEKAHALFRLHRVRKGSAIEKAAVAVDRRYDRITCSETGRAVKVLC